MNALLVGADRLGNIPDVLSEFGIRIAGHVSGRQPAHQKRAALPTGIQVVILFTDFLGHNVMRHFREAARERGLPLLCCRRSTSSLRQAVTTCLGRRCDECPIQGTIRGSQPPLQSPDSSGKPRPAIAPRDARR